MPEDSEGLESDDVEITEKMSIEGAKDYLDSEEEIMDELDVDVPTAAYRVGEPGWRKLLWGKKQLKVESTYDSFEETKEASEEIEKFEYTELVTREDYREALEEAVERERRRILDKIKEKRRNQDSASIGVNFFKSHAFKELAEELEEEADSKTGDSANFGKTRQ